MVPDTGKVAEDKYLLWIGEWRDSRQDNLIQHIYIVEYVVDDGDETG